MFGNKPSPLQVLKIEIRKKKYQKISEISENIRKFTAQYVWKRHR